MRFLLLNAAAVSAAGAAWALAPEHRLPALAAVGAAWGAAFARGIAHPASQLFLPVLSRARDPRRIALTFDDGPGDATRTVLGILAQHGVRATFFVVGANVKGREELLRSMVSAGHVVGTHSFRHSWLTNFLLPRAMKDEVARGIDAVATVIGKKPRLYRPPIGLKSPSVASAVRALDLACVGWRRRGRDGRGGDPGSIVSRLLAARPGEVLLLHDGVEPGATADREPTLRALRELLPLLRARGLEFATVDELFGVRAYA